MFVLTSGGRGYSTKFYTGRLRPEVQPLTLLYTNVSRKGTPFVYLPLKMVPLSHTYLRTLHPLFETIGMQLMNDIRAEQYYRKRFHPKKQYYYLLEII